MRWNFNSIKVRLEPMAKQKITFKPRFQFHKGTIRTSGLSALFDGSDLFQFHKGTIRTVCPYMYQERQT